MKSRVGTVMAAALTLIAGAAGVYGQTKLKAEIGFPFKMQSANLPAGTYELARLGTGSTIFQLRSSDGHQNVLVSARYKIDERPSSDVQPRLVFRCNSASCALSEIWTSDGSGYAAPRPKLSPIEKERLAVVPLTVPKAD